MDAAVWSKEDVAKRVEQEYVAVLIDVDKDEKTPKLYGVSAMPTLVIAEADGMELSKAVGAPFTKPDEAIKWFDDIGGKLKTFSELRGKWDESKHSNAEIGNKLVESATELGQVKVAAQVYFALADLTGEDKAKGSELRLKALNLLLENYDVEAAAEYAEKADKLTAAEGDQRIDLDVVRAKILLFSEKGDEARKIADKHFETLLKATDARAIDLAEVLMSTEKSDDEAAQAAMMKKGRALYQRLAKEFAKHERVWELKVYAAWYGMETDEKEAAKKELAEIAEKGEGRWKEIARSILDEANGEKEGGDEGGSEGEDEMG